MITDLIKSELRSYKDYLSYRQHLKQQIMLIEHEMTGLKAIQYDKIPTTVNPEAAEQKRLGLIEKKDYYQSELTRTEMNINYVEKLLASLNDDDLKMINILVSNETLREAGKRMYISHPTLYYRLMKIINKVAK